MFHLDLFKYGYKTGSLETFSELEVGRKILEAVKGQKEIYISSSYKYLGCIPPKVTLSSLFKGNSELETVILNKTITEIGGLEFAHCAKLKKFVMTDNLTHMYAEVFSDCKSLKEITLSKKIEELPPGTFCDCTSLEYIYIPEGCVSIRDFAFANCTSLKKVFLPKSMRFIFTAAFLGCNALEEICGGDNIECVDRYAFYGCKSLKKFPFNPVVRKINYNAFAYCPPEFSEALNPPFRITNSLNAVVPNGTVYLFNGSMPAPNLKRWKNVHLPESVKNINELAFCTEPSYYGGYDVIKYRLLPEKMNMPKNYFRQKTQFDGEMAFLLAETVWRNFVTDKDFEAVLLYQSDGFSHRNACDRLCENCSEHLNNLLSYTDNSPEQLRRIADYAASYISKIDYSLVEELKSRAEEYNASDALTILNKYCFNNTEREHNPDIDFCYKYLEPYRADTMYLPGCVNSTIENFCYKSDNRKVPEIVLKSVLYAYTKQYPEMIVRYNADDEIKPFEINTYADMLASEFDEEIFMSILETLSDDLEYLSYGIELVVPICRYADVELLKYLFYDKINDVLSKNVGIQEKLLECLKKVIRLNPSDKVDEIIKLLSEYPWFEGLI